MNRGRGEQLLPGDVVSVFFFSFFFSFLWAFRGDGLWFRGFFRAGWRGEDGWGMIGGAFDTMWLLGGWAVKGEL